MTPLATAFVRIRPDFTSFKRETETGIAGSNMGRAGSAEGKKFGEGFSKMAGKLALAGFAGSIALAGVMVASAAKFQTGLNRLVTGAGEAQKALGMVGAGVKAIAVETATSTTGLLSGMYMIESAGFHGAAGLKVLRAAAEGAKAEGADLGTVGNALTTYMKDFHISANQSVAAMDALIVTVSHGKTTMQDLAGALHSVLPIAAVAKLSYAQVGGAIATMTSHGVSAELATQHLAFLIRSLMAPTAVASKEMGLFGLSAIDVSQRLGQRGLTGTLTLLTTAIMSHMGPAGLVLLKAFNISRDAAASANAMLKAMPPSVRTLAEAFRKGSITQHEWTASLKNLPVDQRNMARQFAVSVNSARGFTTALKGNQGASETFSKALRNMTGGAVGLESALQLTGQNSADFNANVKAVGESALHAGKNVDNWKLIQQSFTFQMGQFKQTLEVTGITIGQNLLGPLTKMIVFLNKSHLLMPVIIGIFGALAIAMTVVGVNFVIATIAATSFWTAVSLGLIPLIAALIVGIILLAKHWKVIWHDILVIFQDVWHWLKQNWPLLVAILAGPIGIAALIIIKHWNDIKNGAVTAFNAVVGFIKSLPGRITSAAGNAGLVLLHWGSSVITGLLNGLKNAWTAVFGWVKSIPGKILNALGIHSPPQWAIDAGKHIMGGLLQGLNFGKSKVAGFFGGIAGAFGGGVSQWTGVVLQALSMLHLPSSLLGMVLNQMQSESGGNATAVNNGDSNAMAGTPSKGLMQVIDPTFQMWRSFSLPNDIFNPLSNVYAALNYAMHGAGFGTGAGQVGSMHGYASGGIISEPIIGVGKSGRRYMFGENGPETVTPGVGGGRGTTINNYNTINETVDANILMQRMTWQLQHAGLG